jgi:probable rRNA maturation factor
MSLEVDVQYAVDEDADGAWLPEVEAIEAWAGAALAGRRDAAQFVVRIVGEEEGTELNERYRARKGPTNVLSFPFEHPDLLDPPLLGDVVICAPLVAREAAEQGKAVQAHWAHLVIHGVLHLIGYDHEEESEAVIMESAERCVLTGLGFPDPYAGETAIPDSQPGGGS